MLKIPTLRYALRSVFTLLCLLISSTIAIAQQTIPAGSIIVPMDNTYQSIVPAGQAPFNLKAYGLVNAFLQNGIPVKWAINSNKQRDDIDFTAVAERFAPTAIAAASISFRGGPFIVPDTVLPCGLSTRQIISSFGNNVAVYTLTQSTNIEIKYTLTHHPKIAVFNNGGNQLIHTKILDAASISNYVVMDAADIADLMNCFTFASEPHADSAEVSQEVINGVKAFVLNGGNFLAQCHAIDTYENRGFFHTTSGITTVNATITNAYPNAHLPFSQMHGALQENEGGSVANWTPRPGSNWQPNVYKSVTALASDTVVAMGAHLISPALPGGNVYYLGGHDYARGGGRPNNIPNLTTLEKVNALRMYLNAVFVPSSNSNGAWANAGISDVAIGCSDSAVLGCTQTGPLGSTFLWTPSTGLSCTTCPNPVARPSVTTTYTVQVTNGCIATDTVRVAVGPRPIAQYTNTVVCQGNATSFTDQSTNASFWLWDFGDPASGTLNVSTLQSPTHIFSTSGNFTVTLISGTSTSCADTIVKTVTVQPGPVLIVNSPTVCEGQTATLTASGAASYSWGTGATSSQITVNPTTTTSYTVTGTTGSCTGRDTVTVTVVPRIVPSTTATGVTCFGGNDGSTSVTLVGGRPGYTYTWNTTPIQNTPRAINLTPGTYTVTITDTIGCTATATAVITEPPAMVLTTTTTGVKCYNGQDGTAMVTISGGTPLYSYSWGTHPLQTTAQATGLKDSTYTVTVTDAKGCTGTAQAVVQGPPITSFTTATTDVKCHGGSDGSATLILSGDSSAYLYTWNTSPTQNTLTATSLTQGNYTVSITDTNGCIHTAAVTINEPSAVVLSSTLTQPSCVTLGEATVSATGGTTPYTYSWNTTPVQNTATATALPTGNFTASVLDAHNCPASMQIVLIAPAKPVADFSFITGCFDAAAATFTDRSTVATDSVGSRIITRHWNFGNASTGADNTSALVNPSHMYDASGFFNTTLIVTTDQGCADTIMKPIEVYPIPVVQFGPFSEGCERICVDFKDASTVTSGSINSWLWNFGDASSTSNTSTLQNPTHCYNKTGSYHVSLQVVTDHGCSATAVITDLVKVHPAPILSLDTYKKVCPEAEGAISLVLNAGYGTKYLWSPSGDTTQSTIVRATGTYSVTVTNQWNCTSEASTTIEQVCPPRVFVSNAFSPNGDGTNDMYSVYSAHVGKFQMLIFNRWGEIIFESLDKTHHWDGIYRDEPMPIGVYPWVITYEGDSEEYRGPYKMKGSVTVVR